MKLSLAVHISTEVLWGFGQSFKNKSGQTKGVRMNKAAVGWGFTVRFSGSLISCPTIFPLAKPDKPKNKESTFIRKWKRVVVCNSSLANFSRKIISFKPSFPVKLCKHFILTKKSQNPRNKKLVKHCLHFS